MSTFELEVWDDETDKVTFYTVRWQGAEFSETDKFFDKYYKTNQEAAQKLMSLLLYAGRRSYWFTAQREDNS